MFASRILIEQWPKWADKFKSHKRFVSEYNICRRFYLSGVFPISSFSSTNTSIKIFQSMENHVCHARRCNSHIPIIVASCKTLHWKQRKISKLRNIRKFLNFRKFLKNFLGEFVFLSKNFFFDKNVFSENFFFKEFFIAFKTITLY